MDAFQKALASDKDHAPAWNSLGVVLREHKNDLPAAIVAYKKALAINRDFAHPHFNLGLAYCAQGEFALAIESMDRAAKLFAAADPEHALAPRLSQQYRRYHVLATQLSDVLQGKKTTAAEQLEMADLCFAYLNRCRDAVTLYRAGFVAAPKLAEDVKNFYRYSAACAACVAAADSGKDARIDASERAQLRAWALAWLQADLAGWRKQLGEYPPDAALLVKRLEFARADANLASVRDDALSLLDEAERKSWQSYWADVDSLLKKVWAANGETRLWGALTTGASEQVHEEKLEAGTTIIIEMTSKEFDTFVQLEDAKGKVLVENADIATHNRNSRVAFTAKEDGVYRIVATYQSGDKGIGRYTLVVRRFRAGLIEKTLSGALSPVTKEQAHELKLLAGATVVVDMSSAEFDARVRLEDANKLILTENDDISQTNRNARVAFTAEFDGIYRIIASSYEKKGVGAYALLIREFASDTPAIAAFKKAVAVDNNLAVAWNNFGHTHYHNKDLPAAIEAYRKAVNIDENFALAWRNLGNALRQLEDLPAAIDAYKKVVAIDNQNASAHVNLGIALRDQGKFTDAIASLEQALKLLPATDPMRSSVQVWQQEYRRLLALPDVLKGAKISAAEHVRLAALCAKYRRLRDAVKLYADVFAAAPKLAEDVKNFHRYHAACAAALAAGDNRKSVQSDGNERARFRRQALTWLDSDLAGWVKHLSENPSDVAPLIKHFEHARTDPELAGVRDEKHLAALDASERKNWQNHWANVDELLKKARTSKENRISGDR